MTYFHEVIPPILIQHCRMDYLVPLPQSTIFVVKLENTFPQIGLSLIFHRRQTIETLYLKQKKYDEGIFLLG
jgi:hypothetical protein